MTTYLVYNGESDEMERLMAVFDDKGLAESFVSKANCGYMIEEWATNPGLDQWVSWRAELIFMIGNKGVSIWSNSIKRMELEPGPPGWTGGNGPSSGSIRATGRCDTEAMALAEEKLRSICEAEGHCAPTVIWATQP